MDDQDRALLDRLRGSRLVPPETLEVEIERWEPGSTSLGEHLMGSGALTTEAAGFLAGLFQEASIPQQEFTSPPGTYRVLRLLGSGGLGDVYAAIDTSFQRKVALKVLTAAYVDDPNVRARFENEGRIGAFLDHPNVCPVHAWGENEEGVPFIAMKLVRGKSLADLIDRLLSGEEEALPLPRRVDVVIQACQGLGYAHSEGVIHRDVKPGNIMVGEHGEVLVMDWGLAKATRSFAGESKSMDGWRYDPLKSQLTDEGSILGTPGYMPPEQAAGRLDEVGPHSDVYSLGATLYALLTLQPPFLGSSPADTIGKVKVEQVQPPHELEPRVPPELEAICLKCLEKAPEQRYASMEELGAALRAFRDRWVTLAASPRGLGFWRKWAGMGVVALAAGGLGAVGSGALKSDAPVPVLPAPSPSAGVATRDAPGELDQLLARANAAYMKQEFDVAEADYTQALQLDPDHLDARASRAAARAQLGRLAEMLVDCNLVLERDPLRSRLLWMRYQVLRAEGRLGAALADLARFRRRCPDASGRLKANEAIREVTRGLIAPSALEPFDRMVNASSAQNWTVAHEAADEAVGADSDSPILLEYRARILEKLGRHQEARVDVDRVLELAPALESAWLLRGRLRGIGKDLHGAISDVDRALALDPHYPDALSTRGSLREAAGEVDGAIQDMGRFFEIAPWHAHAAPLREALSRLRAQRDQR